MNRSFKVTVIEAIRKADEQEDVNKDALLSDTKQHWHKFA